MHRKVHFWNVVNKRDRKRTLTKSLLVEIFPVDSIEANVEPVIAQSYTAKPYGAWNTF